MPSAHHSFARLTLVLACGLLASCAPTAPPPGPASPGGRLAAADALLKQAEHATATPAAVESLRAAEIAWGELDTRGGSIRHTTALPEDQRHALRILASATENLAPWFIGSNSQPEKTFSDQGCSYRVSATRAAKPGVYPLARLNSARPARKVPHTLCRNWHTEDGVGVPFAPSWSTPGDSGLRRFISSKRGYMEPLTGVLAFDGPAKPGGARCASLIGYDPTTISSVRLGRTDYPLAADFTAPIVEQTHDINELRLGLLGLIHPGALDAKLILLEPYDPKRIPLLLVHGLNSHPRMWKDVINDLRADPQLRGRYQFMLFYYPTGWPISYSAMRLREELAALEQQTGRPKKMVLIGHSMGGLLARMQVINPGQTIWNSQLSQQARSVDRQLPASHLARRIFLYQADPGIGREIYICTPHRGSGLADLSLTNLFVKLLSLPTTITGVLIDLPTTLATPSRMSSVKGLSPTNPLFTALDQLPIQVPHHSIIGDRGKGDTPHSSDGVVPYWSSHLASARSEVIVPGGHGSYDDPQAIREVRRILLLHLKANPR
ncbi:MAG: alpha/beta fold hydrolase [Verrucomicrobiota bacterium]